MSLTAINKTAVDVIMMVMMALQPFGFPQPELGVCANHTPNDIVI